MTIRKFIKKNIVFSIVSIGFLIWIIFLIILSLTNRRVVIFLDALDSFPGTDVSSDYSSEIPLFRYILEPLIGAALLIGMNFEWTIPFLMIYIVSRGVFLYLKRINKITSEKFRYLMQLLGNFMFFVFKLFSLTILTIAVIILIGYLSLGYFFVSRYFMVIVQTFIRICVTILLVKIIHLVLISFSPKLKYKLGSKSTDSKFKKNSKFSKKYNYFKKEFVYIAGTLSLLLGANVLLISTPFPTQKINTALELDEVLLDFHAHTIMSDGWITPEQRVLWYIDQGITGAVFTDHDNIRGAIAARNFVEENNLDFKVYIGAEWTDNTNDIHMNYYGLEEEIVAPMSETPSGPLALNASDMIKYVKSKGGYVIVNHYTGPPGFPHTYKDLAKWGVDGFEIVNGDHIEAKEIREFCLNNKNGFNESLICLGGSDIHVAGEINAFVKLKLDNPANKTIDNIFKNLRNNNHSVITMALHSNNVKFPGILNDIGFEIFEDYLNYLLNLDVYQCLSWILWSSIAYTFFFLGIRKIKKTNLKIIQKKIILN